MFFNEIWFDSDYLEISNGGSTASAVGTTLQAENMLLDGASVRAGSNVRFDAENLNLYETSVAAGATDNPFLALGSGGSGTINFAVRNKISDGFGGIMVDGVRMDLSENILTVNGNVTMSCKPAEGDLLNTSLGITIPSSTTGIGYSRVSRNTWAGSDLGDTAEGWTNNMALGALILSAGLVGNETVRFDFSPSVEATGALYVRDLYLNTETDLEYMQTIDYGTMIRLNNMKLYYVNCYLKEELPTPPGTLSIQATQWVLQDKFPGNNANVIQTENHPNFGNPTVGPLFTSTMNFSIRSAEENVSSAESAELIVKPLELSWIGVADKSYVIESSDTLGGAWSSFYTVTPDQSGEIVVPLQPTEGLRFFRLICQ